MDAAEVARRRRSAAWSFGAVGGLIVLASGVAVPVFHPPAPQPRAAAVELTSGLALVMGPSGIPQPDAQYVAQAENIYLVPNGFSGTAASLYTPETFGFADPQIGVAAGTDATVNADVADLVSAVTAAIDGHLAVHNADGNLEAIVNDGFDGTQYGTAANPLWVFGYSQSAVAASIAMQRLHDDPATANGVIHFVLVGDPAASQAPWDAGVTDGTGFLNSPFVTALTTIFPGAAQSLYATTVFGLTTPNDAYPTDVYTIQTDPYADFPYSSFTNPPGNEAPGPDNFFGSLANLVSGAGSLVRFLLPQYFEYHREYLSLNPATIATDAVTVPDGEVTYHLIPTDAVPSAAAADSDTNLAAVFGSLFGPDQLGLT